MTDPRQIETQLLAFLRKEVFSPQVAIGPESDLIAMGFDSLSLVRLLLFIEKTYGRWIPERQITTETLQNARTLSVAVAALLHES
jgi:acyl carrier protein